MRRTVIALAVLLVVPGVSAQSADPLLAVEDLPSDGLVLDRGDATNVTATATFEYPQQAVATDPTQVTAEVRPHATWIQATVTPVLHYVPPPHEADGDTWTVDVSIQVTGAAPAYRPETVEVVLRSQENGNVEPAEATAELPVEAGLAGSIAVGDAEQLATREGRDVYRLPVESRVNGPIVVEVVGARTVDVESLAVASIPAPDGGDAPTGEVEFAVPAGTSGDHDLTLRYRHEIVDTSRQTTATVALGPAGALAGGSPLLLVGIVGAVAAAGAAVWLRREGRLGAGGE